MSSLNCMTKSQILKSKRFALLGTRRFPNGVTSLQHIVTAVGEELYYDDSAESDEES